MPFCNRLWCNRLMQVNSDNAQESVNWMKWKCSVVHTHTSCSSDLVKWNWTKWKHKIDEDEEVIFVNKRQYRPVRVCVCVYGMRRAPWSVWYVLLRIPVAITPQSQQQIFIILSHLLSVEPSSFMRQITLMYTLCNAAYLNSSSHTHWIIKWEKKSFTFCVARSNLSDEQSADFSVARISFTID